MKRGQFLRRLAGLAALAASPAALANLEAKPSKEDLLAHLKKYPKTYREAFPNREQVARANFMKDQERAMWFGRSGISQIKARRTGKTFDSLYSHIEKSIT